MRAKLVLGSFVAFFIPALLIGAALGAFFADEQELFTPDVPQSVEERNAPRSPGETLMRLFHPGGTPSARYWTLLAVGFVVVQALGLAWVSKRTNKATDDPDESAVTEELLRRNREKRDGG